MFIEIVFGLIIASYVVYKLMEDESFKDILKNDL